MKKILIMLIGCIILGACTHEKEARELYAKAIDKKTKCEDAIPIYKEIIGKYPKSSVVSSAKEELGFCERQVLEQKIGHNTLIILKAVNTFPARKFPATQKGTLPLGKSISSFESTMCNTAKNYTKKAYSYEEWLAASLFEESSCKYTLGKWNISSQDNIIYIVSKTRIGEDLLNGKKIEKNYTYIVDITNNTIAAKDHPSCFIMSTIASELFGKEAQNIAVDYTKECVFPIKLEGVLK